MRVLLALLLGLAPSLAAGQVITTSPRPNSVAVTVYRDPDRSSQTPLNLSWLNGYALISETRRVSLPAGESEVRFEGVAGGIIPQSAIVSGLPQGIERNRDAFLLSPGTLLDRSLGKRVHLRRTNAAGKVTEQEAVIRSGADGAVVLQTAAGIEALRCSGEKETLVYSDVPAGLSAKPTLSVRVRSAQPIEASVTLSYLATGFDWQANYVAQLSPAGDRVDLFAWLTLANGDETGFANALTQAVAGKPNREPVEVQQVVSRPISLRCWPQGTTSDGLHVQQYTAYGVPPPPPPAPMAERGGDESIVVTGSRVAMKARQENLGDLKLYAIPERVTVAANSQKQVAMIVQEGVKVATAYRQRIDPGSDGFNQPATRTLITRNRTAEGLGLPLPSGGVALFATYAGRPILLGEGSLGDLAIGEDVEIEFGAAAGVRGGLTEVSKGRYELIVTNDGPSAILYEAEFAIEGRGLKPETRLGKRDGRPLWAVTVPANATRTLRYRYDPAA